MALTLSERDKKVIWHPYTSQKYAPSPISIVKGRGAWLTDEQGNEFLDAISSWWVTIHGHAHPYIAQKIYEQALQLEQVIFAGFTHAPAVELAEKLIGLLPGSYQKIFYSDNGSTAVEVAIKMALQYWLNRGHKNRTRILALTNSYHGDTFGAMSVSERGIFTLAFQDKLFEVLFADTPVAGAPIHIKGYPAGDTGKLLDECACVIFEPLVQGAGGMQMHSAAALDQFVQTCRSHGILCIADEVMTGFGRTGQMFATASCTTQPDIICLSKGITGGTMALGVTACTGDIHAAFEDDDRTKTFFHGHSFTANPIACAAALASLELFDKENTLGNVQRISAQQADFAGQLRRAGSDKIKNIRTTGTILAFEVSTAGNDYLHSVKEVITEKALAKNVYLRPLGNTVYTMPPYCVTSGELQKINEVIEEVIATI